jgi:hypothetical protein
MENPKRSFTITQGAWYLAFYAPPVNTGTGTYVVNFTLNTYTYQHNDPIDLSTLMLTNGMAVTSAWDTLFFYDVDVKNMDDNAYSFTACPVSYGEDSTGVSISMSYNALLAVDSGVSDQTYSDCQALAADEGGNPHFWLGSAGNGRYYFAVNLPDKSDGTPMDWTVHFQQGSVICKMPTPGDGDGNEREQENSVFVFFGIFIFICFCGCIIAAAIVAALGVWFYPDLVIFYRSRMGGVGQYETLNDNTHHGDL